jgi:hypothetical protein
MTVVPAGMLTCTYREIPIKEALIPALLGKFAEIDAPHCCPVTVQMSN